jgi:hypothetical protein
MELKTTVCLCAPPLFFTGESDYVEISSNQEGLLISVYSAYPQYHINLYNYDTSPPHLFVL